MKNTMNSTNGTKIVNSEAKASAPAHVDHEGDVARLGVETLSEHHEAMLPAYERGLGKRAVVVRNEAIAQALAVIEKRAAKAIDRAFARGVGQELDRRLALAAAARR